MITHPVEGFNPPENPAIPSENLPIPASPDSAEHANQTPNMVVDPVVETGRWAVPPRFLPADPSAWVRSLPAGFIATYFIHAKKCKAVKIGRARNPFKRMASLRTSSPSRLVLLAVVEGDYEMILHQNFAGDRLHGEWYRATPRLMAFIKNEIEILPHDAAKIAAVNALPCFGRPPEPSHSEASAKAVQP